jgi:hypothetical protein
MTCDNFLYGFKGEPSARQARASPRMNREQKTRIAGEECVGECELDHLDQKPSGE